MKFLGNFMNKKAVNRLPSRNHQKSAAASGWGGARPNSGGPRLNSGGPRPNSGGKREGAGRKYKEYESLEIDYDLDESKETMLRALRELYGWVLQDKIYYRKAATLIHAVEVIAKMRIPTIIEDEINELAAEARKLRKIRSGKTRD